MSRPYNDSPVLSKYTSDDFQRGRAYGRLWETLVRTEKDEVHFSCRKEWLSDFSEIIRDAGWEYEKYGHSGTEVRLRITRR